MTRAPLILLMGLVLAGVGTVYAGRKDERPEIYIVSITGTGTHIDVVGVDGERKSFFFKKKLRLPAGRHQLQFKTGNLKSTDDADRQTYQGKAQIDFDAKNGYTYLSAMQPNAWESVSTNTEICLYEEATDDPKAQTNIFGEFRNPGPNAQKVACVPLNVEPI